VLQVNQLFEEPYVLLQVEYMSYEHAEPGGQRAPQVDSLKHAASQRYGHVVDAG
jgi:hypothetical protein